MSNLTTLSGLFKEVYADQLQNLIPQGVTLFKQYHGPWIKMHYNDNKVIYEFFETSLSSASKYQRHLINWED